MRSDLAQPRISVIISTFQRRQLVCRLVEALVHQEFEDFEAVVVVDGSTDGTEGALAALETPFPLRVVAQANQGLAKTRNRGAAAARGEILLFLDDDMEPDARLLSEHDRCHRAGADAVAGAIPLHPDSASTFLAEGAGVWADDLIRRCTKPGHVLRYFDVSCAQISLRRTVFEKLGGFDVQFTADGSYGNEDRDFSYRLLSGNFRVIFNPGAIAYQQYIVSASAHLRQYRDAGRADVIFARKYRELSEEIFHGELADSRLHRWIREPVLHFPRLFDWIIAPLRQVAVARCDRGRRDWWTKRAFFLTRSIEYWRGVAEADGHQFVRGVPDPNAANPDMEQGDG